MNKTKKWLIAMGVVTTVVVLALVYFFIKHTFPILTWSDLALSFILGFPASIIAQIWSNAKMGQAKLNKRGLAIGFKEQLYSWLVYYTIFCIVMIIYTIIVTGAFPPV